jgi:maltose-binding protein MalE
MVLVTASILACGGKKAEEEALEIVIWEQMDPEEQKLLKVHIAQFTADHPGVTFSVVHFETDQLHSQFQTAALAGGGPDLVYGPSDKVGPYSVMQLIRPLEDLLPRGFFDRFEPTSVPQLDGRRFSVPDQIGNHLMLLYNKALVSGPPADSDEWVAVCKGLMNDGDGDGFPDVYGLVFNYNEPFWLIPFLGAYGGWVMDESNKPTLNTPGMVGALRFLSGLRNEHKVVPRESNYEVSDTMFKMGQAAFLINGPWSIKAYIDAGIDVGVTPLPVITETGRHPAPLVSSKGYSISANVAESKLPLVIDAMTFFTSEAVQKNIVRELLILPSLKSLQGDPLLVENEVLKGSMDQARLGRPMPVIPEMRAIWDAIRPHYQSVLGGDMTPEEAAEKMQVDAEKKIMEMRG